MGDSSASYIRMVQHLIEKCLLFQMTQEECVEALSKYANIKPVITTTVWKELKKENRDFFESYLKRQREELGSEEEESSGVQRIISDSGIRDSSDD